ncbi:uncharacterized protein Z519_02598 [Cladophialophora bantiana CBS 173.52]|uniref:Myb-like DNA-binding domain-containing protein n=1 Tax=Cladophialophora bantiana (strain ATCC 10958 / CBS 173.52 / CDC B-1940 / NIH 8579) TaxID=1442370 RepID=A0A0D2F4P6_CLAB1|nr:uncharacterized protein Z519_02598 [Cladophialophora bantiana CBS 173.52]KIW97206.1 hypothetical protein Z519_02598 [Cladophialophora bantiana CBS 173.52]
MAPAKGTTDDFTFIMTCLKHADVKPKINFEEVAKETGAKSGNACYHRHWGIMKKFGLTGSGGGGRPSSTKTATPRKRKTKGEESGDESTPSKKSKTTPKKKTVEPKVEEADFEDDAEAKNETDSKAEDAEE